ncbi:MAG: PstS family phosphate ABC transporter substrate-binding protein [Candidatus Micrarchaeia archaeon]
MDKRNLAWLVFLLIAFAGCTGSEKKQIKISGSDTMVILGQALAESYMEKNPQTAISVTGGGSGVGIAALIEGTIDIAESSRDMKQEEIEKARSRGVEPFKTIVAYDGIAVIVNKNNPVSELTVEQIGKIFRGEIMNWREVGGPDTPISIYSRESTSGTYEFFKEHVLGKKDYTNTAKYVAGNALMVQSVAQDVNGIGYAGVAYAEQRSDVKIIGVKKDAGSPAYKPTKQTVASGTYPIARSLNFYTNGEPKGEVKKFVDFVLSDEGQAIVENVGYYRVV